jgi:hypothetical protein
MIFTRGEVRTIPNLMRYTSTAELDLMARLAGLTFKERWGDWDGCSLTSASTSGRAISLYRLETRNW